jgi:hypothetical protein
VDRAVCLIRRDAESLSAPVGVCRWTRICGSATFELLWRKGVGARIDRVYVPRRSLNALHYASSSGYPGVVHLLLDLGLKADTRDKDTT